MDFDYFYNREAERFNFLKVPEILVDGEEFKGLSAEAIILYSMLLKRTGMSFKNNWIDKEGRVFIYFTVEEIMKRRNLSKPTAIKILDELDVKKGIGLIERIRLGLGKPNIIYVKDFMSISEVKETDLLKLKTFTSEVKNIDLRSKENELQEVKTLYPNYIDNNKSGVLPIRVSRICQGRPLGEYTKLTAIPYLQVKQRREILSSLRTPTTAAPLFLMSAFTQETE